MNRRAVVEVLAPTAPPCFGARLQWIEYLVAAAEEQRASRHPGPLLFEAGCAVRFNPRFRFCDDCDNSFAQAMQRQNRCSPAWLEAPGMVPPLVVLEGHMVLRSSMRCDA